MTRKPALVLSVLATIALRAAAQPVGAPDPEFRVNTYTTGYQGMPDVAADGHSGFVVVWHGNSPFDSAYWRIAGQRFSSSSVPAGAEFHVGMYTTQKQEFPSVASGGSSLYVVAWQGAGDAGTENGDEVYVQRFGTAGNPLGGFFRVNTYTSDQQARPSVAANKDGNFAIAWETFNQDSTNYGVWGRRVSSTGVVLTDEFQIATSTTFTQDSPSAAMADSGKFVVVFRDKQNDYIISAQRYTPAGYSAVGLFRVSETYNPTKQPSVAMTQFGDFAVVWSNSDGAGDGIFVTTYSQYGYKNGSEFRVNTYTTGNQERPDVAWDSKGNFVVVWTSYGQDGSGYGVFGQRFDAFRNPIGPEFRVSVYTTGDQVNPRITSTPLDDFIVVWSSAQDGSGRGVYARRICGYLAGDADGTNTITVSDVLYLINHLFAGGPSPVNNSDVNGDSNVNVSDVLYLINYLFAGGPSPVCATLAAI